MLSVEERAKQVLDGVMEKLPEPFDLEDIRSRVDEFTPYVMVAIQVGLRMRGGSLGWAAREEEALGGLGKGVAAVLWARSW